MKIHGKNISPWASTSTMEFCATTKKGMPQCTSNFMEISKNSSCCGRTLKDGREPYLKLLSGNGSQNAGNNMEKQNETWDMRLTINRRFHPKITKQRSYMTDCIHPENVPRNLRSENSIVAFMLLLFFKNSKTDLFHSLTHYCSPQ